MMKETKSKTRSTRPLSENWCFVDSCTAESFFRIDRAQEHLHYVTDICTEDLFVLDPEIINPNPNSDANVTVRGNVSNLFEKTSDLLLKAAKHGDLKTLKELHSQGFSLLSIDSQGQTALHHSARLGHKDLIRYLIASAPVTILDMVDTEKGQTALHQAAANRRRTVCCMLVAAGASLSLKDNQGNSARVLAQKAEDLELEAYLLSKCKMVGQKEYSLSVPIPRPVSFSSPPNLSSNDALTSNLCLPVPVTDSRESFKLSPLRVTVPSVASSSDDHSPPQRQGYVSLGTQTSITLTAYSTASTQALTKALAEVLVEEEARLRLTGPPCRGPQFQRGNKMFRVERLI